VGLAQRGLRALAVGDVGFAGSVTDIHGRRVAEDALRLTGERYRQLLDSIDQGFCVIEILLDAQGRPADYRFLEANQRFEAQTGLRSPIGRTARELVPALEDFWVDAYGQVALGGRSRRFAQGSEAMGRWFDVYATPVGEPQERQVALLFQDISERIRGERRLRDSEERYRAFVANSTEGIWRMEFEPPVDTRLPVDAQVDAVLAAGRFAECNETFARMYGFASPADVLGRGLDAVMEPSDPQVRTYLRALVEAGYRANETESAEHDAQGRPLWFANSLAGVVAEGQLVRAWGTQRDITDRKRAEAALREADRRKDEFLATLAHELRNPLAPIRSAAEVLRLAGGHDARVLRNAGIIGRQATHLARMIDDLMDASRISRGKLELRLAPLDLRDAVHAALESTQSLLQEGRHAVDLQLPPRPVRLVGDEVRLVQVVQNLLANAARYSADGAPVRVELHEEGSQAVLRVRDEGIGIAADQLAEVFEMFFQGSGGRTGGGLGIGLSLVQKLTQLHGGTVEAHSAGLGQGSEFLVRLPLPLERSAGPATDTPAAARRGSRRVLVVDDNQDAADTLAEMLRLGGDEVQTAYDGLAGVSAAQAFRPDVVVLDLGMPRLDGYGACRRLRGGERGDTMAVLALSGWGQPADLQRAADAGFDGHLVKPVSPEALAHGIEAALAARLRSDSSRWQDER
ncbi:MAG TPA: ATP-binding protein, partial [Ramlibacter sp.]|nr:ATP-binding protein [Ramlibacter sp.]